MADPNISTGLWPSAVTPSPDNSAMNGLPTSYIPSLASGPSSAQAQDAPYSTFTSPTASKPV